MRTYRVSCAAMRELSQVVVAESASDALARSLELGDRDPSVWELGDSATNPFPESFTVEEI